MTTANFPLSPESLLPEQYRATQEQIDAMGKILQDGCDSAVENSTDHLMPVLIVATRKFQGAGKSATGQLEVKLGEIEHQVMLLAGGFTSAEQKHKLLEAVGAQLYRDKQVPIAAGLVTEAWCIRRDKSVAESPNFRPPSQHHDRQEFATIMVGIAPIRQPVVEVKYMAQRPIARVGGIPDQGEIVFAEPWDQHQIGETPEGPARCESKLLTALWRGMANEAITGLLAKVCGVEPDSETPGVFFTEVDRDNPQEAIDKVTRMMDEHEN
jgi:hypothetical protein